MADAPNLESILGGSYRLVPSVPVRKGCWGEVYQGVGPRGEKLAVKVLSPTNIAEAQMAYRQLTPLEVQVHDLRALAPAAYLMPTILATDNEGRKYTLMPWYDRFFNDLLEQVDKERDKRSVDGWGHKVPILSSGFTIDEALGYASDLANGIAEYHEIMDHAHCDIKPDNIALKEREDKHGSRPRLILGDYGSATVASIPAEQHNGPRDNIGCIYTRSPMRWRVGSSPGKSTDIYAFGCMFHQMFTGKTPLQDEIDDAVRQGGLDGVTALMTRRAPQKNTGASGIHATNHSHDDPVYHVMRRNVKHSDIPEEFKSVIDDCLHERYQDGEVLLQHLDQAVSEYRNRIAEEKGRKEATMRFTFKKLLPSIGTAVALAAGLTTFAWMQYKTPQPDWASRADAYAALTKHEAWNVRNLGLEIEQEYKPAPETAKNQPAPDPARKETATIVQVVSQEFIHTAEQLGYAFSEHDGSVRKGINVHSYNVEWKYDPRWSYQAASLTGSADYHRPFLLKQSMEKVAEYQLGASMVWQSARDGFNNFSPEWYPLPIVDLEDACTRMLKGGDMLQHMIKESGQPDYAGTPSADGSSYGYRSKMDALDKEFIEQWIHNIKGRLGGVVFVRGTRAAHHW